MLSRLVITFLPRSKHLLISWLQSPSAVILEPRKIKSANVSPSVCYEVMGQDAMILVFWMLNFKPTFSLASFIFIKRLLLLGRKAMTNLDSILKSRHYFANKGPSSQDYGFSSSHVWMWELDYKESWARKNWCFWTVVLEKTLESPLDCKEIQPVHPKENQSKIFIGKTGVEAETPILWPPDVKSWLIWKDPAAGKDWRREEKGTTEDEMVGWHHQLNGHEFE